MIPTAEKLRARFRSALRKGYVKNAELDPVVPSAMQRLAENEETFVVRIDSTKGGYYWLTDRRILKEDSKTTVDLVRYDEIQRAHWMFHDLRERLLKVRSSSEITEMKRAHHDRLELEYTSGRTVLDGLSQAYAPALSFLTWMIRSRPTDL